MKQLTEKDLWPLPVYEKVRDEFRREVIAHKQHRRVHVGPYLTFVFEDRLTVKFQVMEILRAEKTTEPAAVHEELEGFNTMLPRVGELSATLLVELTGNEDDIKRQLAELVGLGRHTWLELDGEKAPAEFEKGWEDEANKRFSAVQYVRFPLGALAGKLGQASRVELVVDHPNCRYRAELTSEQRRSLAADLEAA